jgi:hypothetical protein
MMPLLTIVLILLAVGILLWLLNTYGKSFIDPKMLWLINAVVTIVVIIWLMKVFGVWAYISQVKV